MKRAVAIAMYERDGLAYQIDASQWDHSRRWLRHQVHTLLTWGDFISWTRGYKPPTSRGGKGGRLGRRTLPVSRALAAYGYKNAWMATDDPRYGHSAECVAAIRAYESRGLTAEERLEREEDRGEGYGTHYYGGGC